jgi:hypothetical protein
MPAMDRSEREDIPKGETPSLAPRATGRNLTLRLKAFVTRLRRWPNG